MASPIHFPEANLSLGKPADMTDEECRSLPVCSDGRTCISCWQLTEEEQMQLIQNDGKIFLGVLSGRTQPPVFLTTAPPFSDAG